MEIQESATCWKCGGMIAAGERRKHLTLQDETARVICLACTKPSRKARSMARQSATVKRAAERKGGDGDVEPEMSIDEQIEIFRVALRHNRQLLPVTELLPWVGEILELLRSDGMERNGRLDRVVSGELARIAAVVADTINDWPGWPGDVAGARVALRGLFALQHDVRIAGTALPHVGALITARIEKLHSQIRAARKAVAK